MTTEDPLPYPSQFRRRLTVAVAVIAGVAAGLVAIGSYAVVDNQREQSSLDHARDEARVVAALTRGYSSAAQLSGLVEVARHKDGFEALIVADQTISSRPDLGLGNLPTSVKTTNANLTSSTLRVATGSIYLKKVPFVVVGFDVPRTSQVARIYLLFSQRDSIATAHYFRNTLLGGWVAVFLLSVIAANAIARRTLRPIRQYAEAARSLTEGLLHTRLPSGEADEFGTWTRTFNEMASALQFKLEQLSSARERELRFSADIAHDLRTPVASLVSATSLLSLHAPELDPESQRLVQLVQRETSRVRKLITDLLELGKLDYDQETAQPEPVNLRSLMVALVEAHTGDDNVELDVPNVVVSIDRVRLERILSNLVENGRYHAGGTLNITCAIDDNELIVRVDDHGPGIPPDELDHIFDRFHKVSKSRSESGSGLGLAIAAKHASVLNGTLVASNRPEGGARFELRIPITPDELFDGDHHESVG